MFPIEEGLTLSGISKVDPNETEGRMRREWHDDNFNILVTFQNERSIEIGAESALFEPIN